MVNMPRPHESKGDVDAGKERSPTGLGLNAHLEKCVDCLAGTITGRILDGARSDRVYGAMPCLLRASKSFLDIN